MIIDRQGTDFILIATDGLWEWGEQKEKTMCKTVEGAVRDVHDRVYEDCWMDKNHRTEVIDQGHFIDRVEETIDCCTAHNPPNKENKHEPGYDNISVILIEFLDRE